MARRRRYRREYVLPAMIRKIYLAKCLNEGDWNAVRKDLSFRPVSMKVPRMVDGQGAPDANLKSATQISKNKYLY